MHRISLRQGKLLTARRVSYSKASFLRRGKRSSMLCRMREQVLSEALRGPIALCFIVHGMFEHMNVKKRNSSANKSNEDVH